MTENVLVAFALTAIAGLSTGIGSIIALSARKTNTKFLSVSLGFSAGVMIYVSMVELFSEARETLSTALGERQGAALAVAAFFAGMLLIAVIDRAIPQKDNPHEFKKLTGSAQPRSQKERLMRTGVLTALAIAVHNFPEGLATFIAALSDPSVAVAIVVAISIHNIPEGIAVSVPIYYATGSRKKAFFYSFASGLAEPLGALVGYLVLMPFLNDVTFGVLFAAISGIMVFISLDELLPAAREYGEHHLSIYGLVAGMLVMAISLLLLS